jgi:hypothetical protein
LLSRTIYSKAVFWKARGEVGHISPLRVHIHLPAVWPDATLERAGHN